jgi:hypothetical protein
MMEQKSLLSRLPKFFELLPEGHFKNLENQLKSFQKPLEIVENHLHDLYHSFPTRKISSLEPLYGLGVILGFGSWPREALAQMILVLPEYLGLRGTLQGYKIATTQILEIKDNQFEIRERTFPENFIKSDSILDLDFSNHIARQDEEAFSVTFSFLFPKAQIAEQKLKILEQFLKIELPVGVIPYFEFQPPEVKK